MTTAKFDRRLLIVDTYLSAVTVAVVGVVSLSRLSCVSRHRRRCRLDRSTDLIVQIILILIAIESLDSVNVQN